MTWWGEQLLESDEVHCRRAGELSLLLKQVEDELWIAEQRAETSETDPAWARWAIKKKYKKVYIQPRFPDKAVVVKPENPFRLQPGVAARIFVRVPVCASVALEKQSSNVLIDFPSAVLSHTWFGGPTEGELCYWISSSARRKILVDSTRDYLAICPVQLRNKSPEDLLVEKICLRVQWLSMYEKDGQLWANETKVHYKGGDDASQVFVSNGPPAEAENARLIAPPREQIKKSFSIRTFFGLGADEPLRGVENN